MAFQNNVFTILYELNQAFLAKLQNMQGHFYHPPNEPACLARLLSCHPLPSQTSHYTLSQKTVNTRENFWNGYCLATNQMQDETAKESRQIAAGITHDLMRNNEPAFSSTRNQFYRFQILKISFLISALVSPKNRYE